MMVELSTRSGSVGSNSRSTCVLLPGHALSPSVSGERESQRLGILTAVQSCHMRVKSPRTIVLVCQCQLETCLPGL